MGWTNTFQFNIGSGKKYRVHTDDGYVVGLVAPDGTIINVCNIDDVPEVLRSNPRFVRMIEKEHSEVNEGKEYLCQRETD